MELNAENTRKIKLGTSWFCVGSHTQDAKRREEDRKINEINRKQAEQLRRQAELLKHRSSPSGTPQTPALDSDGDFEKELNSATSGMQQL